LRCARCASVDIHSVVVGIELDVVDGQVIDPREQDREVPAVEDREVAQRDVAAELQRDGFVGKGAGLPSHKRLAGDQPAAHDGHILEPIAPDETVCQWLWPKSWKSPAAWFGSAAS